MTHEEWMLHQNFENVLRLIEYVESQIMNHDYEAGEKMHCALVELGMYLSRELEKVQH